MAVPEGCEYIPLEKKATKPAKVNDVQYSHTYTVQCTHVFYKVFVFHFYCPFNLFQCIAKKLRAKDLNTK